MTTHLTMADSTNVADLPNGWSAYAGYVGGNYHTWPGLLARFPRTPLLAIAVNAHEDAQCLDVERGDASVDQIPAWLDRQKRLRPHEVQVIYTSASQVVEARRFIGARKDVLVWSAHYDSALGQHICGSGGCTYPRADATQYSDHGPNRGHYDESVMTSAFFNAIAHRGVQMSTGYKRNQVVKVTRCGQTFHASIHTIAALDRTIRILKRRYPWAHLEIIQPCFNVGVTKSAGTHDKDCVFDVRIVGLTWDHAQRFLRNMGWAAWHRTPAQGFGHHIHMALIPTGLFAHPDAATVGKAYQHLGLKVGEFIDGGWTTDGYHVEATSQIVDYFNHAEGLAGEHFQGYDHTWFPPNIAATVYQFNAADLNSKGIAA